MNHYEVLGVSSSATQEEIDKSYKKKALEHHPDRNPGDVQAHETFVKIQQAYDTLKDANKRRQYDAQISGMGGVQFEIFNNENLDIRISISFTIQEAISGSQKTLKYKRKIPCGSCSGNGFTDSVFCNACHGAGSVNAAPNPFFNFRTLCGRCMGKGRVPTVKCNSCFGMQHVDGNEEEVFYSIPPGLVDGMGLALRGQGNIGQSGRVGNLFLDCRILPDQNFKIDGLNILTNTKIKFSTLLFGGKIEVQTPENEVYEVEIPPKTECLTKFTVKNKGLPDLKNMSKRGDLIVTTIVELPKTIEHPEKIKEFLISKGL